MVFWLTPTTSAIALVLSPFSRSSFAHARRSSWAGWLMGLAVPVIVLTLAKVAGEKWRAGQAWVGGFAGGSGVALLFHVKRGQHLAPQLAYR
jgi:hypothetical protein